MKEFANLKKLSDNALDQVSGGRSSYTDSELEDAGVIATINNGITEYTTRLSNGTVITISQSVAYSMADCFNLSGGQRLTDSELDALISQS